MKSSDIKIGRLGNGLTYILAPNPYATSVTYMISVGAGARSETAENNGIAHFLEHMLFRGTVKRPTSQIISQEVDRMGANNNAFTGYEMTAYHITVAPSCWRAGAEVVRDCFVNSILRPDDIDIERGPVMEESKARTDDPGTWAWLLFQEQMFGPTSLGRDIIGPLDNIRRFKQEDFQDFYRRHYVPANTLVTIAGDFNPIKAAIFIRTQFESLPSVEYDRTFEAPILPRSSNIQVATRTEVTQPTVIMGWPAFGRNDSRTAALRVLSRAFGGMSSSRLFKEVREDRGMAYYVGAYLDQQIDTGQFLVYSGLDNSRLKEALELIVDETKKLRDSGLTEEEFQIAKQNILGSMPLAEEGSGRIARSLSADFLKTGRINTLEARLAAIQAVTLEETLAVAQDVINPDRLQVTMVAPEGVSEDQFRHLADRLR